MSESKEREDPDDKTTVYAVRLSEHAQREQETDRQRRKRPDCGRRDSPRVVSGDASGRSGLSENPRRFAVQPEETRKIGAEVRREIYRHTPGSSAVYHLFYTVEGDTDDGPLVTVIHVRHASRKPLTRAEAKDIRAGLE